MRYVSTTTLHYKRNRKPSEREADWQAIPATIIEKGQEFDNVAIGLDDESEIQRLQSRGFIRPVTN